MNPSPQAINIYGMKNPVKIAILVVVVLCLSLLLSLSACPDSAPGKSFIWKVSSETNSIYLLGSIHTANPEIYPLDSSIEDAFALADNLAVEIDLNQIDTVGLTQLMLDCGTYPAGEGLEDNLPADLYARLGEQFEEIGGSIAPFDMYRPWVVIMLLEELQMEAWGYQAAYGIDSHFIDQAAETGKDIIELETAEYQIELLGSFSDELMILVLEMNLEDPMTEEDVELLFQAWEDGDLATMEALNFEALDEEPALAPYYEAMLDERNLNMAEAIEGFLADDESYFVVVGAGHLVGENGLVNVLEQRGYLTEQLYDLD